ncbi:MAG TPA: gluconate 2-dehydrogenase subunit 3 family protein [Spongiibacteraceae bacterium]|nr:gluconate 2-dehydrogenase subunit 3 family protein [Spongiibacteraceae bacterium]
MNRREFLQWSGSIGIAALAARPLAVAAAAQSTAPLTLDAEQWRSVAAIGEQIIPSVDGIGASAANCANFVDKLLGHEEHRSLPLYRQGLAAIDTYTQQRWQKNFADLTAANQITCLENLEDGAIPHWPATAIGQNALFGMLRFHTILGFLAAPKFGGNVDFAGWRALNFPGHLHEMGGISDRQVSGEVPIQPSWHH